MIFHADATKGYLPVYSPGAYAYLSFPLRILPIALLPSAAGIEDQASFLTSMAPKPTLLILAAPADNATAASGSLIRLRYVFCWHCLSARIAAGVFSLVSERISDHEGPDIWEIPEKPPPSGPRPEIYFYANSAFRSE